jgi:hypothetical protein
MNEFGPMSTEDEGQKLLRELWALKGNVERVESLLREKGIEYQRFSVKGVPIDKSTYKGIPVVESEEPYWQGGGDVRRESFKTFAYCRVPVGNAIKLGPEHNVASNELHDATAWTVVYNNLPPIGSGTVTQDVIVVPDSVIKGFVKDVPRPRKRFGLF